MFVFASLWCASWPRLEGIFLYVGLTKGRGAGVANEEIIPWKDDRKKTRRRTQKKYASKINLCDRKKLFFAFLNMSQKKTLAKIRTKVTTTPKKLHHFFGPIREEPRFFTQKNEKNCKPLPNNFSFAYKMSDQVL